VHALGGEGVSAATFFSAVQDRVSATALNEVVMAVAAAEDVLLTEVGSHVETVQACGEQTLLGGGKRLRPALALVSARATGRHFDLGRMVHVGAALEMIHMATLVHDDVIDESATRRGRATAGALHGNTAAILSGDVLLARAMRLLAEHSSLEVIQLVSGAVVEMAEGEVRELEVRGDIALSEEEHMRVLGMKTAAFMEVCCRVGARMAEAPVEAEDALGSYGRCLGLAFQVVDDLLDFRGDAAKTGKPLATDFREGQATLPLIYLMPFLDEEEAEFAASRFGNGVTDDEVATLVGWMSERGAFAAASERAEELVSSAVGSLSSLPATDDRTLLETVARFVVEREG
jgi:octaprenyl-diphosphate synthase